MVPSFTLVAIIVISIIGSIVIIRIRKSNAPIPEEQTKSFRQQEEFFEEISSDALSLAGMAPILTEEQIMNQNMLVGCNLNLKHYIYSILKKNLHQFSYYEHYR